MPNKEIFCLNFKMKYLFYALRTQNHFFYKDSLGSPTSFEKKIESMRLGQLRELMKAQPMVTKQKI
jgi:hypothetical protein